MPIQFDPFVASQGLAAGLSGKLPEFLQTQNQKRQIDVEQQKQDAEMQSKVQESQFKDAYAAQQLLANGDYDGIVKLGITRLTMLQGLNADPAETQRVLKIAIAARNGNDEAKALLKGSLDSAVKVGTATGVLKFQKPSDYSSAEDATGVRRYTEGPNTGQIVPGFTTPKEQDSSTIMTTEEKKAAGLPEGNVYQRNKKTGVITQVGGNIKENTDLDPNAWSKTGQDFLAYVPPSEHETIKGISEGMLTVSSLGRGQERSKLMGYVMQYDPTFDQGTVQARFKALNDFSTGKNGNIVRSIGVSLSHLNILGQAADALQNKQFKVFNQMANYFKDQTGQEAPADFAATKQIVSDEVTKAVLGGPGSLADRNGIKESFDAANSPEQLYGVINKYKQLLSGQIEGLRQQYKSTTGKDNFDSFLPPSAIVLNSNNTSSANPVTPSPANIGGGGKEGSDPLGLFLKGKPR